MTPSKPKLVDIGDVVRRTGVPASTLHVWEDRGLIEPAGRVGLRRQFTPDTIERIAVILVCQRSGFTLAEIVAMLRPGAFDDGKAQLKDKLVELQRRRDELDAAIDGIEHGISCDHRSPLDCPNFRNKLQGVLPTGAPTKAAPGHQGRR